MLISSHYPASIIRFQHGKEGEDREQFNNLPLLLLLFLLHRIAASEQIKLTYSVCSLKEELHHECQLMRSMKEVGVIR